MKVLLLKSVGRPDGKMTFMKVGNDMYDEAKKFYGDDIICEADSLQECIQKFDAMLKAADEEKRKEKQQ